MLSRAAIPGKNPDRTPKNVKATFRVLGKHVVHGTEPGGLVELDLPVVQVNALIEGGFLELVRPKAPDSAADNN